MTGRGNLYSIPSIISSNVAKCEYGNEISHTQERWDRARYTGRLNPGTCSPSPRIIGFELVIGSRELKFTCALTHNLDTDGVRGASHVRTTKPP